MGFVQNLKLLCGSFADFSFVNIKNIYQDLIVDVLFDLFYWSQLNSGKVVAVGPGARSRDGNVIPVTVKEGDVVLLPEYGGTEVKLGDKEYVFTSNFLLYFSCNQFICIIFVHAYHFFSLLVRIGYRP